MTANNDIVDILNDLIETSKDGEFGFTACAKHVKSEDLRRLFLDRAAECQRAASELMPYVIEFGGEPHDGGSATGALHRGWTAVRGSIGGASDKAMLEECERGEDAALARYRKALKDESLTVALRTVIERQAQGAQRNHDQIKTLRDRAKSEA